MLKLNSISQSSASGGVEPKAETVSIVGMKAESRNPSEDLPKPKKESILNCRLMGNKGFIYIGIVMTYISRKERQTNSSLFKAILSLQK